MKILWEPLHCEHLHTMDAKVENGNFSLLFSVKKSLCAAVTSKQRTTNTFSSCKCYKITKKSLCTEDIFKQQTKNCGELELLSYNN